MFYLANKERISKREKKYRDNNKEKLAKKNKTYISDRLKNDSIFKFKQNTRMLIITSFKRRKHKKTSKTADILGCSLEFFQTYISNQFTKGMTLENHGKWHLDHIVPMATAKTQEDVIRLNHYTNFQPLWAVENLKKSTKIITKQLVLI